MSNDLANKRIGLIGFGRLANLLLPILLQENAVVHGFCRSKKQVRGVNMHCIDVAQAIELPKLDYVIISLTPDEFNLAAYQKTYVQGLQNILQALDLSVLQKLFWVSSTGVYGQCDDEWVTEDSVTEPNRFSGKTLLAAEQLLQPLADKACIVRFSGIYNSRSFRLLESLKAGKLSHNIAKDYYTNRIHEADCARVLAHLLKLSAQEGQLSHCYLASDDMPVKYTDVVMWLSEQAGLPLSDTKNDRQREIGSKRCDNQRLKLTGFEFSYPSFKEGLKPLIAEFNQQS